MGTGLERWMWEGKRPMAKMGDKKERPTTNPIEALLQVPTPNMTIYLVRGAQEVILFGVGSKKENIDPRGGLVPQCHLCGQKSIFVKKKPFVDWYIVLLLQLCTMLPC